MLTRFALRPAGRTALRSSFCRGLAASSGTDDGIKTGRRWTDLFTTTKPAKLVKRKVAIVTGYMGTGYHGLQLNDNVKTIEDDVRQAIFDAGAMRESNFVDLGKIDWARSSRTDKGVHAGCIVFSGKLLIDEENKMDPVSGRVYGLKEALNASLPDNIRVFSCTRVSKRFSARKNCVLREYEYFMPLSFLKDSLVGSDGEDFDTDEAVAEFCRALRRYEGVHDFHNFTRSRSYFYKMQAKRKHYRANYQRNAAEDESDDVDAEDVEDESAEVDSVVDDYSEESSQFEDEEELTRKLLLRHRRSIYSCSGTLVPDFCGEPHLRVHIVGQAFLLNQIRCMVGGALAVATKGMSRVEFDAALLTNRIVRVPIAPAEGLVLLSSSFGGKSHTVSLYEDPNTELAKERKDVVHRVLLNRKEDEEMRQFREEVIYKEISRSWDMEEKMDRWRAYLERCYEANERLNQDELSAVLYEMDQAKLATKNKNQAHVEQNRFELTEYGRKSVGALLPKQFATKLCVRYSVAPGIFTSDLRRAVTRHLKTGKIPLDADEEQILEYIDNYGPANLAKEGRKLRLSIRT
ncbi:tRNA pseudouridine(38-40) synthase [Phytophthora nicotianae CJ01A1]|uniref:tRNA pseudouridine(38-40) synthase n=2 Tax=Phytophthora nicotianae TaxID=4792 RepID=W2I310_PHYNI|nr:tRNA pseudouridine(38-40) synthase [Phytophthora nicotianae]ETL28566.1 tRNA pseudouridine(38-40) synthase [Phytophthora nicotianae]ETP04697.1 tRNA pseudouridine(38-40) synthase [Phytophthora nicotianae CJ01A1]